MISPAGENAENGEKARGIWEVSREEALRQRQEHPPGQIRDWSTRLDHEAAGIGRVRRAGEAARERRDEGNGGVDRADDRQSQQKREEKFFHCFNPKVNWLCKTQPTLGSAGCFDSDGHFRKSEQVEPGYMRRMAI
jgi:hypothetical protein